MTSDNFIRERCWEKHNTASIKMYEWNVGEKNEFIFNRMGVNLSTMEIASQAVGFWQIV